MKKIYLIVVSAVYIITAFSGCGPAQPRSRTAASVSSSAALSEQRPPASRDSRMTVYIPTETALYVKPITVTVPAGEKNPKNALTAMLQLDRQQKHPILPEALLIQSVDVEKGTAYVNFSKELHGLQGGNTAESLFIPMTVNTLTEFPDIQSVQFSIQGRPIKKLSGYRDMTAHFQREKDMIYE